MNVKWECPCCGFVGDWSDHAIPVLDDKGAVCADCIRPVKGGAISVDADLCEFCKDALADCVVYAEDAHRVCKGCKEQSDKETGWWM